jgi:hypothetical protein
MLQKIKGEQMRQVKFNKANPCNDLIDIAAGDERTLGNASYEYYMTYPVKAGGVETQKLVFQNGPINEVGTNGITQEALITVCIDRLECFQNSEFACEENKEALQFLSAAVTILNSRTKRRIDEGTEGTHEV